MYYQYQQTQKIPASLDKVWEFMSSPDNLKKITPPYMGFDVVSNSNSSKMYAGMIITYIVRPMFHIPVHWVTEITHVEEGTFFVDEQRMGPYKLWHHQHKIEAIEGGVLMTDIVTYIPPFGILGQIANNLFIQKKLSEIFTFRTKAVDEIFGKFQDL